MKVRAARGAIVVVRDDADVVLDATERLLAAVLERNAIEPDDLVSVLFTVTDDVGARILQSEAFDSALERFLSEDGAVGSRRLDLLAAYSRRNGSPDVR